MFVLNFHIINFILVSSTLTIQVQNKDTRYEKVSNFEARAVLVPCHPQIRHRSYCGQVGRLGFNAFLCEQDKLVDCVKKVAISVKIMNFGPRNSKPQYVVVDDVFDFQTDTKQKLLYPYVLKIKQEPLFQSYRMDLQDSLREQCNVLRNSKSRRQKIKRNKIKKKPRTENRIPWADCSSCMTYTIQKLKREAVENGTSDSSWNDSSWNGDVDLDRIMDDVIGSNRQKQKRENDKNVAPFGLEGERDILSSIDFPVKSHNKYHCCRYFNKIPNTFSLTNNDEYLALCNMKYAVYKLEEPIIKHHFSVEIFEKHSDVYGKTQWKTLTDKKPLFVGTYDTEVWGRNNSFVMSYSSKEPLLKNFAIFPDAKLLVPEFPYLRGGPERFLVIPEDMFIEEEESIPSSGVHYGGAIKYVSKCCSIKYPPKWFWCIDMQAEAMGRRGNFFLKNFGKLPAVPLHNTTDFGQNLTFYYEGPHQSTLNVEIRADFNVMLKPHTSAVITEVYVDATNFEKTDVTVKVTNNGLVFGVFYVFLTDCPLCLPAGFSNIATSSVVIPPQQQHVFAIQVVYPLPKKKFYCSIDVKNYKNDIIAFRRIRFQRYDRCICIWHCCCTCLEADKGLRCHPLPIDHYNAAGFYGGLPMASKYIMSTSFIEEYMLLMFNLCLTMTILLLVMGLVKGVLGLFYPAIGRFGMEWYLGLPKSIDKYYESNLKQKPAQYDKLDWPIPSTMKKTYRQTSISTEFTINVVFFLLYPLILLHAVVIKVCSSEYAYEKLDTWKNKEVNTIEQPKRDPPFHTFKLSRKKCKK